MKELYECLIECENKGIEINLNEKTFVARKYDSYNFDDIKKNLNSKKIAKAGKCYLSYFKPNYKTVKRNYKKKSRKK